MDRTVSRRCASPEHLPNGAQGTRSSMRLHKNGEEIDAILTEVFGGRGGDRGRSVTEKHSGITSHSTARQRGDGEVEETAPR
jgi:hypothetical protein